MFNFAMAVATLVAHLVSSATLGNRVSECKLEVKSVAWCKNAQKIASGSSSFGFIDVESGIRGISPKGQ